MVAQKITFGVRWNLMQEEIKCLGACFENWMTCIEKKNDIRSKGQTKSILILMAYFKSLYSL